MERSKRLGIFVFFDKEGIVEDYVTYLLNDLRQNLDRLVIVCNGFVTDDGVQRLKSFSTEVYHHENRGFDAAAYKFALNKIGWNTLHEYDELLLCNDTFYGPFWPFRETFEQMANQPALDFWGLTVHAKSTAGGWQESRYGYLPEHLQSFFLVTRARMLHSPHFKEFWDEIPEETENVHDTIENFEVRFTHFFSNEGYSWAPFADTRQLDYRGNMTPINQNVYNCAELIEKFHCPIIKRRAFTDDIQETTTDNGNPARAIEYIRMHSSYDVTLIYRHLLRLENITRLKKNFVWDFVLPEDHLNPNFEKYQLPKALIVMHLYYPELVETCIQYVQDLPASVDVMITTSNPRVKELVALQKQTFPCNFLGVESAPARGRDVAAFLVTARERMKQYKYVCFTHDKRTSSGMQFYTIGESFRRLIMDNVIASGNYVENVLRTFESNPCLGVLAPPPPYMGRYFNSFGAGWQNDFEETVKLADRLHLKCKLEEKLPPYVFGTSLWFRTEAMLPLLNHPFSERDFPQEPLPADGTVSHAIERIFPYVAQSQGYYSGWVMTEKYAELYVEQLSRMLGGFAGEWNQNFPPMDGYTETLLLYKKFVRHTAGERSPDGIVWGAKETFLTWDKDLIRAATLAEKHDENLLYTIGFKAAWDVFLLSLTVWAEKHSIFRVKRELGKFKARQKMPSVAQTWWLVRKTFLIWAKKPFSKHM